MENDTQQHSTQLVRVLMGIQRAAYRADRGGHWRDASEMYRIIGRLMAMNGMSVSGEL